jgi:hypothetical protein
VTRRAPANDSVEVSVTEETTDRGEFTWAPGRGPVAWERTIRAEARVPARPGVVPALASTLEQEIRVARLDGHPACASAGAGA